MPIMVEKNYFVRTCTFASILNALYMHFSCTRHAQICTKTCTNALFSTTVVDRSRYSSDRVVPVSRRRPHLHDRRARERPPRLLSGWIEVRGKDYYKYHMS